MGQVDIVFAGLTFGIAIMAGTAVKHSFDQLPHDLAMTQSYIDVNKAADAVHEQHNVDNDYDNIVGGGFVGAIALGSTVFLGNLARRNYK